MQEVPPSVQQVVPVEQPAVVGSQTEAQQGEQSVSTDRSPTGRNAAQGIISALSNFGPVRTLLALRSGRISGKQQSSENIPAQPQTPEDTTTSGQRQPEQQRNDRSVTERLVIPENISVNVSFLMLVHNNYLKAAQKGLPNMNRVHMKSLQEFYTLPKGAEALQADPMYQQNVEQAKAELAADGQTPSQKDISDHATALYLKDKYPGHYGKPEPRRENYRKRSTYEEQTAIAEGLKVIQESKSLDILQANIARMDENDPKTAGLLAKRNELVQKLFENRYKKDTKLRDGMLQVLLFILGTLVTESQTFLELPNGRR